jgi:hypothetical protein
MLGAHPVLVLTPQRSPGPTEELAPALRGAQLLRQLITTRLAERFILGLVVALASATISRAICSKV